MRLLLDTYCFIWWDNDKSRMSSSALAACGDRANGLFLSVVSIWEMQIKIQTGKLRLRLPLRDILREQQRNDVIIELVEIEDILGLAALPMLHRDPFDRLLVAQAQRGGFHLVSADPQVARYAVPTLW